MATGSDEDLRETTRVEAFSDGVFAIAITLLILEIRLPEFEPGHLREAILQQWPAFLAFLTAFLTILVLWINHHNLFTLVRVGTPVFLLLNGLLLLGVTFTPFPVHLLAKHLATEDAGVAMLVFAGTSFYISVVYNVLWWYVGRSGLLRPESDALRMARRTVRRFLLGPGMYGIATALAVVLPVVSLLIVLGMAVFFAFAGLRP